MDPVIVIGMHRSGTSMITRILADCGLFVGAELEGNHEATFFLGLDEFVYRNAGAGWTRPWAVLDLLDHEEGRQMMVDYFRLTCGSRRAKEFTGGRGGSRGVFGLQEPWGWKDPRATVTLPLWLDIWPDARIVQVDRHGIDVARSLQVRYERFWERSKEQYAKKRRFYGFKPPNHPFSVGHRVAHLDGGMAMWDEHLRIAAMHTASVGERLYRFRYEDFLAEPEVYTPLLLDHCGLHPAPDVVTAAIDGVNASRAYAYRRDPDLRAAATRHQEMLAQHGYDA